MAHVIKNTSAIISLAWRNVWRNKRRSLVVISSIAFGIFAMIISMGIMNGFNVQMVENTIGVSLGHISIHRKGWQDDMKLTLHFIPSSRLIALLKSHPEIHGFSPKIKTEGIIRSSVTSRQVMIIGIDPYLERNASAIHDYTSREKEIHRAMKRTSRMMEVTLYWQKYFGMGFFNMHSCAGKPHNGRGVHRILQFSIMLIH